MNLQDTFKKYFPNKDTRLEQDDAFTFIEQSTKKHKIIEAPTGSGKSLIGMTYGLSLNKQFFVTTPQMMLQKQYTDTIPEDLIGTFYGRSNYKCSFSTPISELNCKTGHVASSPCPACPYAAARKEALGKRATILNTALQFNNTSTKPFIERRILIIDEAHSLERVLCDYDMFSITKGRCKQLKLKFPKIKGGELDKFLDFIEERLIPALEINLQVYINDNPIIELYQESCEDGGDELKLSTADKRIIEQYNKLFKNLNTTDEKLQDARQSPELFVLCTSFDSIDLKFKRAHHNFEKYINAEYDHIMYLSATFVDLDGFALHDLGIPKDEYETLQLPPFFKNEQGSFKYIPVRRNNAWMTDKAFGAILMQAVTIIKSHNNEKGIIHCVNYKQRGDIVDVLETVGLRVFSHDNAKDKAESLKNFMSHGGQAVFVSPSSTEGLDLPDDMCRYVIFTKVPWLNLGDQWVKERMEDDNWYLRQALIATIQGSGRGLRHTDDWCSVYFLDDNFDRIIQKMPEWYIDQLSK